MTQSQQTDRDGNKDQGGLTNRNVTRPDPPAVAVPNVEYDRPPQRKGLEDSNVTQPGPPDASR